MLDDSHSTDYSTTRSMIVQFCPGRHAHTRFNIISTAPSMTEGYLSTTHSHAYERDSRWLFDHNYRSEWLGVMLIASHDGHDHSAVSNSNGSEYYILAWGLRRLEAASDSGDSEVSSSGLQDRTPWCNLLKSSEVQTLVDKEAGYLQLPTTTTAGTRLNGVVEAIKALRFAPSHVLWHQLRSVDGNGPNVQPLFRFEKEYQQRQHLNILFLVVQRLCQSVSAEAEMMMGLTGLVASIEPITFLGNTVYQLHLEVGHPHGSVHSQP